MTNLDFTTSVSYMLRFVAVLCYSSAVLLLLMLGIKYMISSFEEKMEYVKTSIIYLVGSILTFQSGVILQILSATIISESGDYIIIQSQNLAPIYISFFIVAITITLLVYHPFLSKTTRFFLKKQQNTSVSTSETSHLIARLLMKKNQKNLVIFSLLLFSALIEGIAYFKKPETSTFVAILFISILEVLNFVNQRVLDYRTTHGLYGTCYSEAKEIVAFILDWHRKNGDSNSKPPKLVFTQEEIDQCLQVNGGKEYAG